MNSHFFTAPFYFAFIWFKVQGSRFRVQGCGSGFAANSNGALRAGPLSLPLAGKGDRAAVDRVLSLMAYLRRSPSLFFIPLVPYPPLRGTFPSRGRLCVEDSVVLVSQPSPLGKGDRASGG